MEQDGVYEMTIGEVAEAMDATVRTIRYYESVGLLGPADRSVGGHRRYTRGDLDQLRRVLALRRCGFGLEAIRSLLGSGSREEALGLARRQLLQLEIGSLEHL